MEASLCSLYDNNDNKLAAIRCPLMHGKLELNLDPAFIGFASDNHKRYFSYCQADEVLNLLEDLQVTPLREKLALIECFVSVSGDFPTEVLARHGLLRHQLSKARGKANIGHDLALAQGIT